MCALISTHHIFNFTIDSPSEGCIPRNNILWTVWILSIHCFLLPILMIIFGILTLNNLGHLSVFCDCIHGSQHRSVKDRFIQMCAHCIRCRNSFQHKIDRQLTTMIISEIFVTVFTSLPYGSYAFYHLIYGIQIKETDDLNKTEWIPLFIRMTMYFEASCGFYIYLITLTTLRKRFWKILIKKVSSIHLCFCCK
jgi:hypothetical protein